MTYVDCLRSTAVGFQYVLIRMLGFVSVYLKTPIAYILHSIMHNRCFSTLSPPLCNCLPFITSKKPSFRRFLCHTRSGIIAACQHCSDASWAMQLFQEMPRRTLKPNTSSYNALLAACEAATLWEECLSLLSQMQHQRLGLVLILQSLFFVHVCSLWPGVRMFWIFFPGSSCPIPWAIAAASEQQHVPSNQKWCKNSCGRCNNGTCS